MVQAGLNSDFPSRLAEPSEPNEPNEPFEQVELASQKKNAAAEVVGYIKSGHIVALGTGSTASLVIRELGRRTTEEGLNIRCICSSYDSLLLACKVGLRPETLQGIDRVDICIDGADEIDAQQNLLKGAGGAHTLEKILYHLSGQVWIVADSSKKVAQLGERFPIPVEILPPAYSFVQREVSQIFADRLKHASVREGSGKKGPLMTDHGNLILDIHLQESWNPFETEMMIQSIPGVIESGIFSSARKKTGAIDCVWGRPATIEKTDNKF